MNIKQAVQMAALNQTPTKPAPQKKLSAQKVAELVFKIAAQDSHAREGRPKQWAQKWLASDEFVLMDIVASKVALPHQPTDQNRLLDVMMAAGNLQPVVVDVNKRSVGMAAGGYIPPVIVVDGVYRHRAATMNSQSVIKAWVGVKALKRVQLTPAPVKASRLDVAAALEKSPAKQAPGAGVGPRLAPDKGASNSEIRKIWSGDQIKQMVEACKSDMRAGKFKYVKKMYGKTPPGCEDMVQGLKESSVDNPWAVAWHHYNTHGSCSKEQ